MFCNSELLILLLPLQYVMPNIRSDAAQSRANYLGHAPIAKKN